MWKPAIVQCSDCRKLLVVESPAISLSAGEKPTWVEPIPGAFCPQCLASAIASGTMQMPAAVQAGTPAPCVARVPNLIRAATSVFALDRSALN